MALKCERASNLDAGRHHNMLNRLTAPPKKMVNSRRPFTTSGQFVREYDVDATQGGAFGLDTLREAPFNYAVIDDVTNSLSVSRLQQQ